MEPIADHQGLIAKLGGSTVLARKCGWPLPRVGQWKLNNRIPPEYWAEIITLAANEGLPDITSDWLMVNLPPRKPSERAA